MSPSKTPGGLHAIREGKKRYAAERERYRANLRRRREAERQMFTEIGKDVPAEEVDNAETVVAEVAESHQNSEQPAGCIGAPVRSPQGAEKGDSSE